MTDGRPGEELVAAVRAGDPVAVRGLLERGADPDTAGAGGLPVLCEAVAGYDWPVAEALVEGGADPDRVLPDGTTPLWRAVDGGSPAVFGAVVGHEPRLRLPEPARARLLDLARTWYTTGVVGELRRRTGVSGPATTVRVQEQGFSNIHQVSLGGHTVRDGHAGVLTSLEWAFRILTPVDELVARALTHGADHVTWSDICLVLAQRRSAETWSAVTAYRRHPEPAHRLFVADFLWTHGILSLGSDVEGETELLTTWAMEETDGQVLAKVLDAFTINGCPGGVVLGLRHAGHPDARVRREVPYLLQADDEGPYLAHAYGAPLTPEVRSALLGLTRDPDPEVRVAACQVGVRDEELSPDAVRALLLLVKDVDLGHLRTQATGSLAASLDHTPEVADALAGLLTDDELLTRLEAAYGLALRDDPRTGEAIERVIPLDRAFVDDHRVSELWRWSRKRGTSIRGLWAGQDQQAR